MLGSQTYTKAELLNILNHPNFFDASVILAVQLIAAKLNIAAGSDPTLVSTIITHADGLLSMFSGKLPYHVNPFSNIGQMMVHDALTLECYNNGKLTPGCCHHGDHAPLDPDWCDDDDGLRHDHEPCVPCDHTPTPTPTPHHTPTPTATPHHNAYCHTTSHTYCHTTSHAYCQPPASHTYCHTTSHTYCHPTSHTYCHPHHTPTATPHHNTYCHTTSLMGINTARGYSSWIPGEKHRSERNCRRFAQSCGRFL